MALSIQATLRNSANKALRNTDVRVYFYDSSGRAKEVAKGRSAANGTVRITTSHNLSGFLPQVLLRARINNKLVDVTNSPKSFSRNKLDFGVVKISNSPSVSLVSGRKLHVLPPMVNTPGTIPLATRPADGNLDAERNKEQLQKMTAERNSLLQEKATLKEQLQTRGSEVSSLNAQKASWSQQQSSLKNQLAAKTTEIDRLKAENVELRTQTGSKAEAPTISSEEFTQAKLLESVSTALDSADNRLEANQSKFQIQSAQMEIKALSGSNTNSVYLLKNADAYAKVNPNLFSRFQLDFGKRDQAATAPPASPDALRMPTLTGYTRSLAERKLAALGLQARFYEQQLVAGQAAQKGQVLSQIPAKNTLLQSDTQIILIVGTYQGGNNGE